GPELARPLPRKSIGCNKDVAIGCKLAGIDQIGMADDPDDRGAGGPGSKPFEAAQYEIDLACGVGIVPRRQIVDPASAAEAQQGFGEAAGEMIVAPFLAHGLARAGDLDRERWMKGGGRLGWGGRRTALRGDRALEDGTKRGQAGRFPLWNVGGIEVRAVAVAAIDRRIVRLQFILPTLNEGAAIAVRETAAARRAAFMMNDDGRGFHPTSLTEMCLQPKAEVVVFLSVDENGIEAMEHSEITGADRETGAADHGERARRAEMWRIAWKAAVELIRNVA